MSTNQISINNLSKAYDNGFEALKKVNLEIKKGEIMINHLKKIYYGNYRWT